MADDLLQPNPFAKPILATDGDRAATGIYTAVGFALDRWEHCEDAFSSLYASIIVPPGHGNTVVLRSFGALIAASTKREMIQEAADAFFRRRSENRELLAEVRHLLNLYKDAGARRNEIAHAIVMGFPRHKFVDNKAVPLPTLWFLVPSMHSARKRDHDVRISKYRLASAELRHLTACFEALTDRAHKASTAIRRFQRELAGES